MEKVEKLYIEKSEHRDHKESADYHNYDNASHQKGLLDLIYFDSEKFKLNIQYIIVSVQVRVDNWVKVSSHQARICKQQSLIYRDNERHELEEEIRYEHVVVSYTHTIVDPRAVVIIPIHATVANDAMTTSWCADSMTFRAQR